MTAIFKRELRSYFHGMLGYVLTAFLLASSGIYFLALNLGYHPLSMHKKNSRNQSTAATMQLTAVCTRYPSSTARSEISFRFSIDSPLPTPSSKASPVPLRPAA